MQESEGSREQEVEKIREQQTDQDLGKLSDNRWRNAAKEGKLQSNCRWYRKGL
jgi:hypothetical protein